MVCLSRLLRQHIWGAAHPGSQRKAAQSWEGWSCLDCAGSDAVWGRVLARLGQQGFPEAWKWEEASARLKSRGKRIQKTQRNNIEFFLILNFQLTMENVKVCEIEWRGAVCRRGSRLWQARTREALMARIPNHKSIFTQRKELCFPPFTASGCLAGWARLGESRLLGASLGSPGCW